MLGLYMYMYDYFDNSSSTVYTALIDLSVSVGCGGLEDLLHLVILNITMIKIPVRKNLICSSLPPK